MIKKILTLFAALILVVLGIVFNSVKDSKTLIIPYPYSFNSSYTEKFKIDQAENIEKAEKSQILIIGDEIGVSLNPYIPRIIAENPNYLRSNGAVFNWSAPKEPLFRTIAKLKLLNKIPPVVIYLGANSELKEQKFDSRDYDKINHNLEVYEDEKLISLIITFPILSKFIYQKYNYIDISTPKTYTNLLSSNFKQKEKEINFKLFTIETQELIDLIRSNKSQLILSSTPINIQIPPKESCSHTQNQTIIEMQQSISSKLLNGQAKEVTKELEELSKINPANAETQYLLARAHQMNGRFSEAYTAFKKANIFDCENWRGNAIYNSIMAKKSQENGVVFIDFDKITSGQLMNDGVFIDNIYPHNTLYIQFINEVNTALKRIFRTI